MISHVLGDHTLYHGDDARDVRLCALCTPCSPSCPYLGIEEHNVHADPVRSPEEAPAEPVGDVGDLDTCPTCAYPLAASVPWHARLPEGTMCALTPPSPEPAP